MLPRAALLFGLLLALASGSVAHGAPEGCYAVTRSADSEFRKGMTPRERAKAKVEAKRRRCSTKPVADGTPGAIDAAQARDLLPHLRDFFKSVQAPTEKRATAKRDKNARGALKANRKAIVRHAVPRPRPARAPQPVPTDASPPAGEATPAAPAAAPRHTEMPATVPPVTTLAPELTPPPSRCARLGNRLSRWICEHW